MRYDENWAIAPERIRAFFLQQPDVYEEGNAFRYRSCLITLESLSGKSMGKWEIKRTRIIIEGNAIDAQAIHHRFFLRFLSAGG